LLKPLHHCCLWIQCNLWNMSMICEDPRWTGAWWW
jgi:hypothetical protein